MKKFLLWLVIILTFPALVIAEANGSENQAGFISEKWLVLGAFAREGGNSFYRSFLLQPDREFSLDPHSRSFAAPGDSLQWLQVPVDKNGFVDLSKSSRQRSGRQIAYAYTTLKAESERKAVFTFGHTGSIEVWLNGESIHFNRISRKLQPDRDVVVVTLRKGENKLLVKSEGTPPYFGFYQKVYYPFGALFVNTSATIIPDFRVGERVSGWGQVEVANVSRDSLKGVMVKVRENDFMIPAAFPAGNLAPGEVRGIPFWLASRFEVPDSTVEAFEINIAGKSTLITPRLRQRDEYFVTTYRSALDGSVQPYSLLVPTSYRADEAYPLIVLLHGAWVTGWGQNIISYDMKEWAIQVAVHDRGNNRYRDIGEVDLEEVLFHVKQRYQIDQDRMFLAGHSMGGYGTWFQAVRHPDRWASISPQAGYTDYFLYHPAMSHSNGQDAFHRQLLVEWSPLFFAENLLHVPAYIIHGAKDDNVVVEHARKMAARLQELNYTFVYDENPDAGHWWGPRGKFYGTEVVDKPPIWSFFHQYERRVKNPARIIYKTNTLRYNKAYWITIDELDTVYHISRISAEVVSGNKLNIHTENISQFTLDLASAPIEPGGPLSVYVDSSLVYLDHLPGKRQLTLRKDNGQFIMLFSPDVMPGRNDPKQVSLLLSAELNKSGKMRQIQAFSAKSLMKSSEVFGPVVDAFNTPFLFVIGTQNVKSAMNKAIRLSARRIANSWSSMANGQVTIKLDTELTQKDIMNRNLVLYGDQTSNAVVAGISGQLPIYLAADKVQAGQHFYTGQDIGVVFVYPNPLNHDKYIVTISGTTANSYYLAARLPLNELPDFVVFDRSSFVPPEIEYQRAGFFNKYWTLPEPIIGENTK